jgi:hypothetical protein
MVSVLAVLTALFPAYSLPVVLWLSIVRLLASVLLLCSWVGALGLADADCVRAPSGLAVAGAVFCLWRFGGLLLVWCAASRSSF